jgi:hypothetical protein
MNRSRQPDALSSAQPAADGLREIAPVGFGPWDGAAAGGVSKMTFCRSTRSY